MNNQVPKSEPVVDMEEERFDPLRNRSTESKRPEQKEELSPDEQAYVANMDMQLVAVRPGIQGLDSNDMDVPWDPAHVAANVVAVAPAAMSMALVPIGVPMMGSMDPDARPPSPQLRSPVGVKRQNDDDEPRNSKRPQNANGDPVGVRSVADELDMPSLEPDAERLEQLWREAGGLELRNRDGSVARRPIQLGHANDYNSIQRVLVEARYLALLAKDKCERLMDAKNRAYQAAQTKLIHQHHVESDRWRAEREKLRAELTTRDHNLQLASTNLKALQEQLKEATAQTKGRKALAAKLQQLEEQNKALNDQLTRQVQATESKVQQGAIEDRTADLQREQERLQLRTRASKLELDLTDLKKRYDEARREEARCEEEKKELAKERKTLAARVAKLDEENQTLNERLTKQIQATETKVQQGVIEDSTTSLERAQDRLEFKTKLAVLTEEFTALKRKYEEARREEARCEEEKKELAKERKDLSARVAKLDEENERLAKQIQATETKLQQGTINDKTASLEWAQERLEFRIKLTELKTRYDEAKRDEAACEEEKKKLTRELTDEKKHYGQLRDAYTEGVTIVLTKYMPEERKRDLLQLVATPHESLMAWHRSWMDMERKYGNAGMETDDWDKAELLRRFHETTNHGRALLARYNQLQSQVHNLVSQLNALQPPFLGELNPLDRLTQLRRIISADHFLDTLYKLIQQFVRESQPLANIRVLDAPFSDAVALGPMGESPVIKTIRAEQKQLAQNVHDLTLENLQLTSRLHEYTAALAASQTLVDRVNAIWLSLDKIFGPNDAVADVASLQSLARERVAVLRKEESGRKSTIPRTTSLIGSDDLSPMDLVAKQVRKLTTLNETQREELVALKRALEECEEEKKTHRKLQRLCEEIQQWGASLASTLWWTITGAQLQPERILEKLTLIKRETDMRTQPQAVQALYAWMARSLPRAMVDDSQNILNALQSFLNDEFARNPNHLSDWITDFQPTAPIAGMDLSLDLTGLAQQSGQVPVEDRLSIFAYRSDEFWEARRADYMRRIREREEFADTPMRGNVIMNFRSDGVQATNQGLFTLTDQQGDTPMADQSDEKHAEDAIPLPAGGPVRDLPDEEIQRFQESLSVPPMVPINHILNGPEPTSVRKARWKVYGLFALHLRWITWFSRNTPTLSTLGKWPKMATEALAEIDKSFQEKVDEALAQDFKLERQRTVAVIQGMRNLTDLQRIEWNSHLLELSILTQRLKGDGRVTRNDLNELRERTIGRIVRGTEAIWWNAKWGDQYPAEPLEKYAESRFTELMREWNDAVKEMKQELKEQDQTLKDWGKRTLSLVKLVELGPNQADADIRPLSLDFVGQRVKEYQAGVTAFEKAVLRLAKSLMTFQRKLAGDEEKQTEESTAEALATIYIPRIEQLFDEYLGWPKAAKNAFETANKHPLVTAGTASLEFVRVTKPADLPVNMDYLLKRIAIKTQSMELVSKLLQNRLTSNGPRPPKNATKSGANGTGAAIHMHLACKPRKELLEPDDKRAALKVDRTQTRGVWKSPTRRVFEFLVHMAGKAACDLTELVIPKFLEDQNGQSLHVIPVDALDILGGMNLQNHQEDANAMLPAITEALTDQQRKTKVKTEKLNREILALREKWNVYPDDPVVIEEELGMVMTGAGHTAVVAALAFLRRSPKQRDCTLLGFTSHYTFREPFVEYCAAEYKFRQLQNLATPAKDRSAQDRAVVNQQLTFAQNALLR